MLESKNPAFNGDKLNVHKRKPMHVPIFDVDDISFKSSQDSQFITSINNMMQVPPSITLDNGHNSEQQTNERDSRTNGFSMDLPEKLTSDIFAMNHPDIDSSFTSSNSFSDRHKGSEYSLRNNTTTTPPSSPTKYSYMNHCDDAEKLCKTPQISADLFARMRPRRSSLEVDLHEEVRILRDKINSLENECQINTRSCRLFYAILCGYLLVKSFSWFVKT